MTETQNKNSVAVGDKLTALTAVTVPNPAGGVVGINVQRGSVLKITESFMEDTKDRSGFTWLSDLSETAQINLWGEQRFIVGDASDRVLWWQGDESSTRLARDHAKLDAERIADPKARAAAHQAIRDTFGKDTGASKQYVAYRVAADNDPHARRDDR